MHQIRSTWLFISRPPRQGQSVTPSASHIPQILLAMSLSLQGRRGLTTAVMIITPNIHIIRLIFRHHRAFSYLASSIGPTFFSRSCSICVCRGAFLPFRFGTVGFGGRGRKEAMNQAAQQISVFLIGKRGGGNGEGRTKWKNEAKSEEDYLDVPFCKRIPLGCLI